MPDRTPEQQAAFNRAQDFAHSLGNEMSELLRQRLLLSTILRRQDDIEKTVARSLCTRLSRMARSDYLLAMARAFDTHRKALGLPRALDHLRDADADLTVDEALLRRNLADIRMPHAHDFSVQDLSDTARAWFRERLTDHAEELKAIKEARDKLIAHSDPGDWPLRWTGEGTLALEMVLMKFCHFLEAFTGRIAWREGQWATPGYDKPARALEATIDQLLESGERSLARGGTDDLAEKLSRFARGAPTNDEFHGVDVVELPEGVRVEDLFRGEPAD